MLLFCLACHLQVAICFRFLRPLTPYESVGALNGDWEGKMVGRKERLVE